MVVTDYHKKRTMVNVQMEGTMEFPTRWLCCTSKRSCESESRDHISTYRSRKREKYRSSAQERNTASLMILTRLPGLAAWNLDNHGFSALMCLSVNTISSLESHSTFSGSAW